MQVGVLGPVQVRVDGAVVDVAGTRVRTLLARLALAEGAPVATDALVDAVWPGPPPADVANALQTLVSRLRRVLGGAASVRADVGGYRLDVDPDDVDAHRFTALARAGRRALQRGDPEGAERSFADALALWRGPALPELPDLAAATGLDEQRLDVAAEHLAALTQLGRTAEVAVLAESLAVRHPLRERFTALLAAALQAEGRTAEALAAHDRLRRALREELGVDPSPELRDQLVAILRETDRPAARGPVRTNLPAGRTSFLGRDDELARIDELLTSGRLVTVVGPGGAGKTRLAGVAAGAWADRLDDGVWLTELAPVTDPAGVAQAVLGSLGLRAGTVLERRDGPTMSATERLVDVLGATDCLLVLDNCEHLVAAVAQLADHLLATCPGVRLLATSREPLGIDGEALCLLSPLVVPPPTAGPAEALGCSAVALFVDRARAVSAGFRLDQGTVGAVVEVVRRLDGLPLAIELAAARLRTLPVQEIARRLSDRFRLLTGGSRAALPRHRTLRAVVEWSWELLSPGERLLAERLAVFPSGATTTSATEICADPSLPPGLPGSPADVADLLDQLVDKSLLQAHRAGVDRPDPDRPDGDRPDGDGGAPTDGDRVDGERVDAVWGDGVRYRMLETLREHGVDQLAARGELGAVRLVHARWFADLVERADPWLRRREQLTWMRRLEDERDNVLAALRHLADVGELGLALRVASTLGLYWMLLGAHTEAATWLDVVLAAPDPRGTASRRDRAVVQALQTMNTMASVMGDRQEPTALHCSRVRLTEVAAELARLVADGEIAADDGVVALVRPMLLFFDGAFDEVLDLLEVSTTSDDPWVRAAAFFFRSAVRENEGQVTLMRADVDEALRLFTGLGERWGISSSLSARAQLRLLDGDVLGAIDDFEQAARLVGEFGATGDEVMVHLRLSGLYARTGDLAAARREADLVAASELEAGSRTQRLLAETVRGAIAVQIGDSVEMQRLEVTLRDELGEFDHVHPMDGHVSASTLSVLGLLQTELDDLDGARETLLQAHTVGLDTRDMPIMAGIGLAVARWAEAVGDPRTAAQVLGATAAVRGADDVSDPIRQQLVQRLGAQLGETDLAAELATGRAMDRATALARLRPEPGRRRPPRADADRAVVAAQSTQGTE